MAPAPERAQGNAEVAQDQDAQAGQPQRIGAVGGDRRVAADVAVDDVVDDLLERPLARIAESTGGRSLLANRTLIVANAQLAGEIAVALRDLASAT